MTHSSSLRLLALCVLVCICGSLLAIIWNFWQLSACVSGECGQIASTHLLEYEVSINPADLRRQVLGGTDDRLLVVILISFAIMIIFALLMCIQAFSVRADSSAEAERDGGL